MTERQSLSPDNQPQTDTAALQKRIRELESQASRLQQITDNLFDLVALTDLQGNFSFTGKSHEIFGYDPEAFAGKNVMDFIHPEDLPRVTGAFHFPGYHPAKRGERPTQKNYPVHPALSGNHG